MPAELNLSEFDEGLLDDLWADIDSGAFRVPDPEPPAAVVIENAKCQRGQTQKQTQCIPVRPAKGSHPDITDAEILSMARDVTDSYVARPGARDLAGRSADWTPTTGGRLFHGTSVERFQKLGEADHVFLTDDFGEARAYSDVVHDPLRRSRGTPTVRTLDARPGKTLNIDKVIYYAMKEGFFDEDVLEASFRAARDAGASYVTYKHPSYTKGGGADQNVIVALHPQTMKLAGPTINAECRVGQTQRQTGCQPHETSSAKGKGAGESVGVGDRVLFGGEEYEVTYGVSRNFVTIRSLKDGLSLKARKDELKKVGSQTPPTVRSVPLPVAKLSSEPAAVQPVTKVPAPSPATPAEQSVGTAKSPAASGWAGAVDSMKDYANTEKAFKGVNSGNPAPSPADVREVKKYTGHDFKNEPTYARINRKLRTGGDLGGDSKTVEALDRVIAQNPAREDVVVYRAVSRRANEPALAALKEGDEFTDQGYSSTSTSWATGADFQAWGKAEHRTFRILVPKGQPALAVSKQLKDGPTENEVLLPRGTRFKVTKIENVTLPNRQGQTKDIYHLEIVPQTVNAECKVGQTHAQTQCTPKDRSALAKGSHKPATKEKQDHALAVEERVASALGGRQVGDNAPTDVSVNIKGKVHGVEVKTVLDSSNDRINMHRDAYERKAKWSAETGSPLHTVVTDDRDVFKGGENRAQFSGNKFYYKRGGGSFLLTSMHPVSSYEEARRLMELADDELPEAARSSAAWRNTVKKAKRWKGKGQNVGAAAVKARQESMQ